MPFCLKKVFKSQGFDDDIVSVVGEGYFQMQSIVDEREEREGQMDDDQVEERTKEGGSYKVAIDSSWMKTQMDSSSPRQKQSW